MAGMPGIPERPRHQAPTPRDPIAITAWLGVSDAFDRSVTDSLPRYADQDEPDYQDFVHPRLRRELDEQYLRARRESRETAPGRLRLLALPGTLSRWCRIRSYLDSAANHGLTALAAISTALAGQPWLPAIPDAA